MTGTVMKVAQTLFVCLISLLVSGVLSDGVTSITTSSTTSTPPLECGKYEKCYQCIQTLGCLWCKDKNLSLESRRCFANLTQEVFCEDIVNPEGTVIESNRSANRTGYEDTKISPQQILLSLRKGEKVNFTLQYTDEKHRPLDLYIVMDLSFTMKKHKDKVANLASTLAENLKNLTSNLRMGFGSFVDKPLPPFGFISPPDPAKKSQMNDGEEQIFPYSFKNHLKLTDNVEAFINELKSTGISSNVDYPEGTLDGLLQSTVCTEQIGWRTGKGNRKLIVISTDGSFHFAGDGKLLGVVLPHDGICYVDSSEMYTHSTVLDYPSVSLVRQRIRENDVFVIFAVTKEQESTYKQLSQYLKPFAVTHGIDDDNSITSVIEKEYKKLVNTVTLLSKYNQKEYIDIKFYAQCPGHRDFVNGSQCNGVGPGVSVNFKVEVELKDCPTSRELWKSVVTIYPQSSTEYMTVNLSMLCGCDCETENLPGLHNETMKGSPECSNNGYLQCGACQCSSRWGGPFCNCSVTQDEAINKNECIDPNTRLVCNNRGRCDSCGKCKCDPVNGNPNVLGGKYCQCDSTACPRDPSDEGICNIDASEGPHGQCTCSSEATVPQCVCREGFKWSRCECPTSNRTCEDPNTGEICNKKGSCGCGKCECELNYKGAYCEIQPAKVDGSCEAVSRKVARCVECLKLAIEHGSTDELRSKNCEEECRQVSMTFKPRIGIQGENDCGGSEVDEKGCRIDYLIWGRNTTNDEIYLEMESIHTILQDKCPAPAPLLEIVSGIIGAMILIGLMTLLLWKVVTHLKDRQEYERFEKSIQQASWNTQENPLYKSTTSQFQNPAYVHFDESEAIS